jgi:hypothetical protein
LKWQNLVAFIHKISLGEATKPWRINGRTFTPNGIGEYAGKALFFENQIQKSNFPEPHL